MVNTQWLRVYGLLCLTVLTLRVSAKDYVLPVPGFGELVGHEGEDPVDAVERFSQVTRKTTGHRFSQADLDELHSTLCNTQACEKKFETLSLDLPGIGNIAVHPGQAPSEAIDNFLVRARNEGHPLAQDMTDEVLDYFCQRKVCAVPLGPTELEVTGMGTIVVEVGQDVSHVVESFARAAWAQGHNINLDAVRVITERICTLKECQRPVNLPPASLDVQGIGQLSVPFGIEPADVVEEFVGAANRAGFGLDDIAVHQIMEALCNRTLCHRVASPVSLNVSGIGILRVPVGEEPADSARRFIDSAIRNGAALTRDDAVSIMQSLCELKPCHRPLDLEPSTLAIENIGTVVLPLGAEPVDILTEFLESARSVGHRIGANDAGMIMERLCGLQECRTPLNVAPLTLNISDVGVLVVPFGAEPAEAVADFFGAAKSQGHQLSGEDASVVMERVCSEKTCNVALDVSPIQLNITGVGTLVIPFGHEPADQVARFLLQARAAGHRILADGAEQIMKAACQRTSCSKALDVSPFPLNVSGIGTLVVPFGEEPAHAVHRFVDQVVEHGGQLDAAAAQQIFEAVCQHITCFQPLDVSPFVLNVTGVGTLVVPYGVEPTDAVDDFLRQAIDAGHEISSDGAALVMEAVCQRLACHKPLDVTPFTLEISDVGNLVVPYGVEPAVAVANFIGQAMDAGHQIGANGVNMIMQRVCSVRKCSQQIDTNPFRLNIPDMNSTLEIVFGEEPADAVKVFLSRATYNGYEVTTDIAQQIMTAVCERTACRRPLDLSPLEIPVSDFPAFVLPFDAIPQFAVRSYGNANRLSAHAMQELLNAVCARTYCQPEVSGTV